MRARYVVSIAIVLAGAVALAVVRVGASAEAAARVSPTAPAVNMDLSSFSDAPPASPLRLLFIHHSVGGQLLADPGPANALADSIYVMHPNGGGLRRLLEAASYEVHETSYGSAIGEATDLFDWLPKFRDHMDEVLRTEANDRLYADGRTNQIVVFKSCYPNNRFRGMGREPGNPAGPELTLANAKATLRALLPELAKQPSVLFVYVTIPPVAPRGYAEPLWKWLAKTILRRPTTAEAVREQAKIARTLNDWVTSPDGWLAGYELKNVVVFDYYDLLTDHGASNLSRYATGDGDDSHPSRTGNERAAAELVRLLNRAVRRAGSSS